jgi:transposase
MDENEHDTNAWSCGDRQTCEGFRAAWPLLYCLGRATTFLAALRHDGLTAPLVIDGAINGKIFLAWVKQELLPTLREGDIVVMDNLSSHKVAGVKGAIESVRAKVLYLPPYSPDFNPIEMVFSKLKTLVRKAKVRKMEDLWRKLGELCDVFPPKECKNYCNHEGDDKNI